MKDELFDTPEKAADAITIFENGIHTPFWKLMQKIIDGNIAVLQKQLVDGSSPEETYDEVQRLRDKIKLLTDIRNTPETMIDKLKQEDVPEPNPDPYEVLPDEAKA